MAKKVQIAVPTHKRAAHAFAKLSTTAFGRAALEKHGHEPMTIEHGRAYTKSHEQPAHEAEMQTADADEAEEGQENA